MRIVPREAWGYGILLVILCAIASVAVWQTIAYLSERVPAGDFHVVAGVLWALSLGFMLIAGSFGLWATRFAAEAESRRRLSSAIAEMDHLSDGLLAVDSRGRVTGSNRSARELAGTDLSRRTPLRAAFPCLSDQDAAALACGGAPVEVEREFSMRGQTRALRFRSQPSEGLSLVFVSDVTASRESRLRQLRAAQLHLIGEISRGVAHDMNSLLCGISGHASLVQRLPAGSPDARESLRAVADAAERGIAMAGHLLELAAHPSGEPDGHSPDACVRRAAELIRYSLPEQWSVRSGVEALPPVSLAGPQLEQAVVNLALLAAEAAGPRGVLKISCAAQPAGPPSGPGPAFAAVVTVHACPEAAPESDAAALDEVRESGLMHSVIRTVVEQSGGRIETFHGPGGARFFRLRLAPGQSPEAPGQPGLTLPVELQAYVAKWNVLLATGRESAALEDRLAGLGVKVVAARDIVSALARVQDDAALDVMVFDEDCFQRQQVALLRAVLKLRPTAGLVVRCGNPKKADAELSRGVVFVAQTAPPDHVLLAMIESRSLAARRGS